MEISSKKKIVLLFIVVFLLLISFCLGVLVGQKTKHFKVSKSKFITFYQVKKHINKETNNEEKNALKLFIIPYEECLKTELTSTEKQNLLEIQKEVLSMAKGNDKVKFKMYDLQSAKKATTTIKKTRKCQKKAYKHMTKSDKRLLRSALSKLKIDNIIAIYHGIR